MNKIEKMIEELCPNGVEVKKLKLVANILNGYSFKSSKYSNSGIRVIRISDVQKGKISNKDIKYYPKDTEKELKRYLLKNNDLVMSLTGNVGRVAMLSNSDLPAGLNQRVACIRARDNKILTRYLYHFFDQNSFENDAMANATGGGQKNMSTNWLGNIIIPIPPLSIQEGIVSILDKFTQLEAELEAELEARKTQYEHYRDELLSFGEEVERESMKKVADFSQGIQIIPSDQLGELHDNFIRFLRIVDFVKDNEPPRYIKNPGERYIKKEGELVMIRYGASAAGKVFLKYNGAIANNMFKINLKTSNLLPKFMFYYLSQPKIYKDLNSGGGVSTMPAITFSKIGAVKIPLPSLREQKLIISILDKFDTLVNDISAGIPAEIRNRKKQHEYYRNRLLSFKENK